MLNKNYIYSTDHVKSMSLERRKCLAHDEDFSKLPKQAAAKYKPKYFSYYTMQGCVMECRAMHSLKTCGCLPYYFPEFKREKGSNGYLGWLEKKNSGKGCNVTQLACLSNISGTNR